MATFSEAAPLSRDIEIERRLAAVLAADVAGFSRLTEADEIGTLRLLAAQRAILDNAIARHRGRIANTAGDSVLAEFPSAVNAVQCAVEAQRALRDAAEGMPENRRVQFRIGIHVGDVAVRGGDLLGTGVNVAARLEALAEAGGIVLSAATHEQVKKILPLAYADLGPQRVKNLEEPVRAFAIGDAPAAASVASTIGDSKSLPLPDKPSIAVLPFQNMSGDPEQEYFADGMVEDIITALSRFKSLFVVARNSSFTYKRRAVDVRQVGRELKVRYVLEGSIRKAAGRVRITAQLLEADTGMHVWADKFDRPLEDVFDLQDQVTSKVVQLINPQIQQAEIDRTRMKPTSSLDSYDLFLRGMALVNSYKFTDEARHYFRESHRLDPQYAIAYAMDGFILMNQEVTVGRALAIHETAEALRLANMAVELGDDDAHALSRAAHLLSYFGPEFDRATSLVDRSIVLNPNLASAWHARGWIAYSCCQPERAIESFENMARFNPRDRARISAWIGMSYARFQQDRCEEGFELANNALQFGRTALSLPPYIVNAVATGHLPEARKAAKELLNLAPDYRITKRVRIDRLRDTNYAYRFLDHLRASDLPE
jgi:adenylate cyclase